MIENLKPSTIHFGHYGCSTKVNEVYNQFDNWLQRFMDISTKNLEENA